MMNALSGLLDKILMKDMNSSQLQFWYMLFMVSYYVIYMLVTRTKLSRDVWKNGWIWLLSILFVAADKALFIANGMADSRVTIMTLLKQSGCVVAILAGKFIFKEKNTGYKLFCAAIIVIGIVIGVM
jgi:drug/metabolite transporter (DMT)-like permease